MVIRKNRYLGTPPAGTEPYCSHHDKDATYYNSYGGGIQETTLVFDWAGIIALLGAGSTLTLGLNYSKPCGGCGSSCEINITVPDDPADITDLTPLQTDASCGCCTGYVSWEMTAAPDTFTLTSKCEAATFSISHNVGGLIAETVADPAPTPYGNDTCINVGTVVTQLLTAEYYSPKVAHPPTGATIPDEVFIGIVKAEMHNTKADYDSCCECPCIGPCEQLCVKKSGSIWVKLAQPLTELGAVGYYINDPASDMNGQIVAVGPSETPDPTWVEISGSSFSEVTIGGNMAIINY